MSNGIEDQIFLTVFVNLRVHTEFHGQQAYEEIKEWLKHYPFIKISGQVVRHLEPCCGEAGKT